MNLDEAKQYVMQRYITRASEGIPFEKFVNDTIKELANKDFSIIVHNLIPIKVDKVSIDGDGIQYHVRGMR